MKPSLQSSVWDIAPVHKGLDRIQPALFERQVPLLGLRIPATQTGQWRQGFPEDMLKRPRVATVTVDPDVKDQRILLLKTADRDELSDGLRAKLDEGGAASLVDQSITLPYEYWRADQILQSILPDELCDESPVSFAAVGHIAHINLRDEYLPYKHLIGQVLLDKNPNIRTVVNKLDTIDHTFRFFKMEVLAGEPEFNVELSESDCRFKFDFSKVYWNSRLSTEHGRLVDTFNPIDIVADGFAGVGPFAIPAAKKGCAVLANDLNPASADSLRGNIPLNKVQDRCRAFNMDGKDFVGLAVREAWERPFAPLAAKPAKKPSRSDRQAESSSSDAAATATPAPGPTQSPAQARSRLVDHFVMNLPDSAITFLGFYRGIYKALWDVAEFQQAVEQKGTLPLVHCYCFTKMTEGGHEEDICQRAEAELKHPVNTLEDYGVHFVRSVAPKKDMYRLSFRLPMAVLLDEPSATTA